MNVSPQRLLATGWSLHLPGLRLGTALADHLGEPRGAWAHEDPPAPEAAATLLGRKGLLYKEPATRLALCAVHRALGLQARQRPGWPVAPEVAVVACSNLGNVETVAQVTRTVATEGGRGVSVLDAPNVSSNVVASTVALWFGFGGPNLMVCSGATAGLDGVRLAGLLLRARRAERVVLVGAEPADEVATALHAEGGSGRPLRAGAACVVLEAWHPEGGVPAGQDPEGGVPAGRDPEGGVPAGRALVELVPEAGPWPRPPRVTIGRDGFDPAAHWGDCYGAEGVVALALAAHLAADEGHGVVGVRCEGEDGSRAALVSSAESAVVGR
ncbi:beta-ketoacyl synthase N-terminal-like domain-containing protein [Streptosporangium sp. NPDC000396]|uniref:beta-ketoacyl synthase N-terminal-like domain-containing protein n=1 Tax=Streptosporangium sp. NPDC000396 TaxID=3366185 RepID=UPI0036825FCB